MLTANPAARAAKNLPSGQSPEMTSWTAAQTRDFLDWSAEHSELHAAWQVALWTGLRRGELLGLRWSDVNLDKRLITVRQSAVPSRVKGRGLDITIDTPKSGKSRMVDVDDATALTLAAYKVAYSEPPDPRLLRRRGSGSFQVAGSGPYAA